MADRELRDRTERRFDDQGNFKNRGGSLDERISYGKRLGPGFGREPGRQPGQPPRNDRGRQGSGKRPDGYKAPSFWAQEKDRNRTEPNEGVGSDGYRRSDERILAEVRNRLIQHAQIDACEIHVDVKNGVVSLTGIVEDQRMKRLAERNIEMVLGVVRVRNELDLRSSRPDVEQEQREQAGDTQFPGGPTSAGPTGFDSPRTRNKEG